MSGAAVTSDRERGVATTPASKRVWFAIVAALAAVASVLPPLSTLAQRYVFAATIQFMTFAVVAPALIAIGAPWAKLGLARADGAGPADRLARARGEHRRFIRAGLFLLVFMAVALAWRLPPVMNALVRAPALVVLELATMLPAGTALWLELLPSPPLTPRLPRPQRAAVSAMAMWFIWVIAYVVGMNKGPVFGAYAAVPGRAMGIMSDQEIGSGIMWVVTAVAFIPIVLTTMLGWIGSEDTDEEFQRQMERDENQRAVVRGWGRPAAGRRSA